MRASALISRASGWRRSFRLASHTPLGACVHHARENSYCRSPLGRGQAVSAAPLAVAPSKMWPSRNHPCDVPSKPFSDRLFSLAVFVAWCRPAYRGEECTSLASSSGALVDWLNGDWGTFFIITALMVIPSLILLYKIKDKINLND